MTALGLLVLRIGLATVLLAHGAHDLVGALAGPGVGPGGLAETARHFESVGLIPGYPLAALAAVTQVIGGFLLVIGWLTRWAALAVAATLGITVWKDHLPWGLFLNWTLDQTRGHGVEYALVLIAGLACLALTGGGALSIDGRREHSAATRAAGRARLRGR